MRLSRSQLQLLAKKNPSVASALSQSTIKAKHGREQHSLCGHLAGQLEQVGAPEFHWEGHEEGEFRFCPDRRWRFDFFFPGYDMAVEVEGGVSSHRKGKAISKAGNEYHIQSRHLTPKGFEEDALKYFYAQLYGYSVIRVTSGMVSSDAAIGMTLKMLLARGWVPAKNKVLVDAFVSIV